jgi:L-alanine-DL-glutamate epimerase-like enolase superfamily enzyme
MNQYSRQSPSRRGILQGIGATALAAAAAGRTARAAEEKSASIEDLVKLDATPVLKLAKVKQPVVVKSVELLKNGSAYLVRARSTAGVEAVTVPNPSRMAVFHSLFLGSVVPTFLKKDARELESLIWDNYRAGSNYKLQGLAYWICIAAIEMALLELLARTAECPVADLFGGQLRRDIAVYYASGNRGNTPEAEVEYLQKLVADSGAKAIKFRLGGRMNRNVDSLPKRTETLIPLVRRTFGDKMTLYADSNSSYDTAKAIRIGKIMEQHQYGFYEEPCEFDDLWSTKAVADALKIPVAGGEQEFSMHRWRWMIASRGVDIVQPDLHYGGGFIRAARVARMAAAAGMTVVPHMSGGGLGYLDVVHFASFTPNIGPFMEFKGNASIPVHCESSSLRCENGIVRCPTGTGFGVTIDPDFVRKAEVIK